jgi:phosphoglycerate dehydrogenase-like enzyme
VTGVWYRGGLRRSLQAGAAASADRRIAGAGLDVFDTEPLPTDHPLRRLDNVVLTPHLGYVSVQNYRAYFAGVVEDIRGFLDGKPVRAMM